MSKAIKRILEIQALLPGTVRAEAFVKLCQEQADLLHAEEAHMSDEAFVNLAEQMLQQNFDRLNELLYVKVATSAEAMLIAPTHRRYKHLARKVHFKVFGN